MFAAITRALLLAERAVVAIETIGAELRALNATLADLTYDPNCDTTIGKIHEVLHDTLHEFESDKGVSLTSLVRIIAGDLAAR